MIDLSSLDAYNYELPHSLIAQKPTLPRDHCRLLIVDVDHGSFSEIPFYELPNFLQCDDRLIFNNTRVIPARLIGKKATGAKIELLLSKQVSETQWEALAKPARKVRKGDRIDFCSSLSCIVDEEKEEGIRMISFLCQGLALEQIEKIGHIPLPPYIRGGEDNPEDKVDYQTVFASMPGAVAAPTAGLHFTPDLISCLCKAGITRSELTLHVGLGTFLPVKASRITEHKMHVEYAFIDEKMANEISATPIEKRICVGTTTCRALEAAYKEGKIASGGLETAIFITPGYIFGATSSLLTNFHLPKSTLMMLVCAVGGYELVMEAYRKAVKEKFRFYSYGDAMLLLKRKSASSSERSPHG